MDEKLAKAYADFSLGLMRAVRSNEAENTFLSPASISTVLSMLYAGAAGDTASEMSSVMFGNCEESAIHEGFGSFLSDLCSDQKPYDLSVANRIYTTVGFEPEAKFMEQLAHVYKSTFRQVDFEAQAESVCNEINKWVSEVTRGKIIELLHPQVLSDDTMMVLVNAIYFKGNWKKKFKEEQTSEMSFHMDEKNEQKVRMMYQKSKRFRYFEDSQIQAVMLPYMSEDVSMLAILPQKRFGLEEVIQSLTGERLMNSAAMCQYAMVEVFIPKFKMEQSFDLNAPLQKLGMGKIFGEDADFSGITNTKKKKLVVSKVVHKAFVEVNEEGSESAAATAVGMMDICAIVGPPVKKNIFRADQPFLFFIWSNKHNLPLFSGVYAHPAN